ncbi:MAG: hypothetical protein HZB51_07150 [Chloroflexi bacterium]|nr:hypothetical protein [Chloroflexota bacterium]
MQFKIILVVSCALLLSACSSVSAAPPVVTATAVPTETPTATSVPPTTVPTPTPTAVPPTTVPTLSPTVTPTQSTITMAQGCNNPFYPVSNTAQWQYRISSSFAPNAATFFTQTMSNITPNSFVEHRVFDNTNVNTNWTCANGALSTTRLGDLGALMSNQLQLTITKQAGVVIPSPDRWQIGNTWTDNLGVSGQLTTSFINVSGTGTADFRNKIVSQDSVQAPAGTFRALRVDSTITLKMVGTAAGVSTPFDVTIAMSEWFARDVGLVRATMNLASESATLELVSTNLTQSEPQPTTTP